MSRLLHRCACAVALLAAACSGQLVSPDSSHDADDGHADSDLATVDRCQELDCNGWPCEEGSCRYPDDGSDAGCEGELGAPTNLATLNTADDETTPWLHADGRTLYFASNRPSTTGTMKRFHLWVARRADRDSDFGPPEEVSIAHRDTSSDDHAELSPTIMPGLPQPAGETLYMGYKRVNREEHFHIRKAERDDSKVGFERPAQVWWTEVESGYNDMTPWLSRDGQFLFISTDREREGDLDLWMAIWDTATGTFGQPTKLLGVNTTSNEGSPAVTAGGLYFASDRSGLWSIYLAPLVDGSYGTPVLLDLDSAPTDGSTAPSPSADGRELFFTSTRAGGAGGWDLWVAERGCE